MQGFVGAAVIRAIENFVDGRVARDSAFFPSLPELLIEVRREQEREDIENWRAVTTFVVKGSPEWRAICERRGVTSLPSRPASSGEPGWWVPKDELAALAPERVEYHRALLEHRDPRPIAVPQLRRVGDA